MHILRRCAGFNSFAVKGNQGRPASFLRYPSNFSCTMNEYNGITRITILTFEQFCNDNLISAIFNVSI